jgi:hypothetical protein
MFTDQEPARFGHSALSPAQVVRRRSNGQIMRPMSPDRTPNVDALPEDASFPTASGYQLGRVMSRNPRRR